MRAAAEDDLRGREFRLPWSEEAGHAAMEGALLHPKGAAVAHMRGRRGLWVGLRRGLVVIAAAFILLPAFVIWQDRNPWPAPSASMLAVPNAFDWYREAGLAVQMRSELDAAFLSIPDVAHVQKGRSFASRIPPVTISPPNPGQAAVGTLEAVPRILTANREALRILRQGFRHFYTEPPIRTGREPAGHYEGFLRLSRLLALEADYWFRKGQPVRGVQSALDAVRLGITCQRGASLIGMRVGMTCEATGRAVLWAHTEELSARDAATAARTLEELNMHRPTLIELLYWTRDAHISAFVHESSDPFWRWRVSERAAGPVERFVLFAATLPHSRPAVVEHIRRQTDFAVQFYLASYPKMPSSLARNAYGVAQATDLYTDMAAAALEYDRNGAMGSLLTAALALRAYKLDRNKEPGSLVDLVRAGYLKRVPTDPYTVGRDRAGLKPLQYGQPFGAALVYSLGPDGRDDGGVPIAEEREGRAPPTLSWYGWSQGDYVADGGIGVPPE